MEAVHLPPTASPEEVVAALHRYGYAIVDDLAPIALMDRIAAEMAPYVAQTAFGADELLGLATKRTGALIARSPAARELVMNPTALGTAAGLLHRATTFQLHLTQIISLHPGGAAQQIHRDQVAWDFFPFPQDYDVQCNILWALTDYTEEMGATRVVPASHLDERNDYTIADSIPAVMRRGSAFFYTGKVCHGGGANVSDRVRQAINITYSVGWVRQEENQYLTTPIEIARTLPEELQRLMGYQTGCFAMGYVSDFLDPISVLRPDAAVVLGGDVLEKREGSEAAAIMAESARRKAGDPSG